MRLIVSAWAVFALAGCSSAGLKPTSDPAGDDTVDASVPDAPTDTEPDPGELAAFASSILEGVLHDEFRLGGEYVIALRADDVLSDSVLDRLETLSRELASEKGVHEVDSISRRLIFKGQEGEILAIPVSQEAEQGTPPDELCSLLQTASFGRTLLTKDRAATLVFVCRDELDQGSRLLEVARRLVPDLDPVGYDLARPHRIAEEDPAILDMVGAVHVRIEAQAGGDARSPQAVACLEKLETAALAIIDQQPCSLLDILRTMARSMGVRKQPSAMSRATILQFITLVTMVEEPESLPLNRESTVTVMTIPAHPGLEPDAPLREALAKVRCPGFTLSVY